MEWIRNVAEIGGRSKPDARFVAECGKSFRLFPHLSSGFQQLSAVPL
jgi:hypothetical protein